MINKTKIKAVVDGDIIPIEEVRDPLFSNKIIGNGCGIEPTGKKIYSPIEGKVEKIASTRHAIYLSNTDGLKLLIHIGIDTVELKGEGFISKIEEGMQVQKDDVLIEFDPESLEAQGFNSVVAVVVLNSTDGKIEVESFPQTQAIAKETDALLIKQIQ